MDAEWGRSGAEARCGGGVPVESLSGKGEEGKLRNKPGDLEGKKGKEVGTLIVTHVLL